MQPVSVSVTIQQTANQDFWAGILCLDRLHYPTPLSRRASIGHGATSYILNFIGPDPVLAKRPHFCQSTMHTRCSGDQ
jgi:hypothetical protein